MMPLYWRATFLPITLVCKIFLASLLMTNAQESSTFDDLVTSNPYDETFTPAYDEGVDQASEMYIRKCHCLITEYLTEDGLCVEHPQLIDSASSSLFNVTVEDIFCSADTASVTLPQDLVIPTEGGIMYVPGAKLFLSRDSYCFENSLDVNLNITRGTKICLAALTLTKCCQSHTKLTIEKGADEGHFVSCLDQSNIPSNASLHIHPHITFESIPLKWNETEYQVSPVHCLPGHELVKVRTEGSAEAALIYGSEGVNLEWMSPYNTVDKLPPSNFCIDVDENNHHDSYFCYLNPLRLHNEICEGKICVRKCCPIGQIYDEVEGCFDGKNSKPWMPEMHNSYTLQVTKENITVTTITGLPICLDSFFQLEPSDPFILMDDGRLRVLSLGTFYTATSYCVDKAMDANGTERSWAVVCFDAPEEDECSWQGVVQLVALALSCVFIVATLFVYISVTEISRKLASKCVISESIALLMSFLSLIILQGISSNEVTVFCVATGLLFYYATLASFFWLNVMCFDMYFTINSMLPVKASGSKMTWFLRYSLYGWGMPLLFLIAVCVCDNLPLDIHNFNIIRSNIFVTCHIPNKDYTARWTYVYGPMLVLLVVNIVLFVNVAVVLVRQQQESAKVLHGSESQTRHGGGGATNAKANESPLLCLKLFVVMGVTWLTEIISFAEGNKCYVWLATDIINCLRGLFIFIIFVCKRDVIKKLKSRWRPQLALVREVCCPTSPTSRTRAEHSSQVTSSAFWPSRKTSDTSLFSFGPKRKASSPEVGAELQKMEAFNEVDETKKDSDVKF